MENEINLGLLDDALLATEKSCILCIQMGLFTVRAM